ncbi:MAG TPA: aldehyde dehydrogenase family protein, partial [Cupriavidus sp.]|nr:aldehyde dehydrogenase family protein [Cupriavidus sp.]
MDLPPPWTPAEGAAPGVLAVRSPIDGEVFGQLAMCDAAQANARIARAHAAQTTWALTPAPARGEVVRRFGEALRANKDALGRLVSLESGKILQEGLGEVQEMIDIC